jgi:hypothetical protein
VCARIRDMLKRAWRGIAKIIASQLLIYTADCRTYSSLASRRLKLNF